MSELGDITEDLFLDGQLRLRQPKRGHRAGHDAILLAAATHARAGDCVADFGAGVGTAGLALARRVNGVECVLVEIDPALAALARGNAQLNGLKASVYVLDVTAGAAAFAAEGLFPDRFDAVVMNPPFNDVLEHRPSPDAGRQVAHMAGEGLLAAWVHAARRVLKPGGSLTLIWRANGLADVLAVLDVGFGGIRILPVHPDARKPAIRIIVTAIKGSRGPLTLCRSLMLNGEDGEASTEARAALGGLALSFASKGGG